MLIGMVVAIYVSLLSVTEPVIVLCVETQLYLLCVFM